MRVVPKEGYIGIRYINSCKEGPGVSVLVAAVECVVLELSVLFPALCILDYVLRPRIAEPVAVVILANVNQADVQIIGGFLAGIHTWRDR